MTSLRPKNILVLLCLMGTACDRVYYQPSRKIHGDAAKAGYAFEERYLPSASGNTLHGRLFHRKPGTDRKGLWVFFHGNSRNLTGTYNAYAWVTALGWDYFVFDYSGYGKSTGKASRETLFQDGLSLLRYVSDSIPAAPGEK